MDDIDITITGGVFGLTERRTASLSSLDPCTIRLLTEAFGAGSTCPVPCADDPARDARIVSILMHGKFVVFHEHRAPPFWHDLARKSHRRGD